jgi:predicted Zn-dependent protease with MMP-like domain
VDEPQLTSDGPLRRRRYAPRSADAKARHEERRDRFNALVQQAIDELPPEFADAMQNVDIVVAERPTAAELRSAGVGRYGTLLGLYHGTPQTSRGSGYNLVLPDKITLYRRPIEASCRTDADLVHEVRKTLLHEIAHHFGIDDDRLAELGRD